MNVVQPKNEWFFSPEAIKANIKYVLRNDFLNVDYLFKLTDAQKFIFKNLDNDEGYKMSFVGYGNVIFGVQENYKDNVITFFNCSGSLSFYNSYLQFETYEELIKIGKAINQEFTGGSKKRSKKRSKKKLLL